MGRKSSKLCLRCPHRIHQLCPADDLGSLGYLHLCWGSSPEPPTIQPVHCKCRHVCPGHGPIPLSKQVQRINYKKKINTGIRCHLVSRPANTPKGWSTSPQCTNPTNHLLRFAGIGRQDTAFFFVQTLCAAFVSHDCLSLADCLPPYVIAGKLLFTSGGEKHKQQCKIWQFSEMLDNQGLLWRKALVLKTCSRLTHGHCLNVKCKFQEY